jgi:hypothetical protein
MRGTGEMRNAYKILRGRDLSEDTGVDGRIISEWILEKWGEKLCSRFMCLGIRTSGGLVRTRLWTFGFHKGRTFFV